MTGAHRSVPRTGDSDPTGERLSRLLALGIRGPGRPLDALLSRLSEPDASDWLRAAIETGPLGTLGPRAEGLYEGRATVEELAAVKEECKALLRASDCEESRLVSMLSYFLAVAAALVHHDTLISSRSRLELEPLLLDLAEVAPSPWPELLARAALAARASAEEGSG